MVALGTVHIANNSKFPFASIANASSEAHGSSASHWPHLDLIFSVLVTSEHWDTVPGYESDHRRYPRIDICLATLETYAAIPFARAFFYVELSSEFADQRDRLHTTIRRLFGPRVHALEPWRPTRQVQWRTIWERVAVARTTAKDGSEQRSADNSHLIFFAQHDDHPFVDYDTSVLHEGLALMRSDPAPHKALYLSHWAQALKLIGKVHEPIRRGASYAAAMLTQLDAIQIFNRRFLRRLLLELDWRNRSFSRIDMLVRQVQIYGGSAASAGLFATSESWQKLYVPLRELCRKFDAYAELGIPHSITPPLELPWARSALPVCDSDQMLQQRMLHAGLKDSQWNEGNRWRVPSTWVQTMLERYGGRGAAASMCPPPPAPPPPPTARGGAHQLAPIYAVG